MALPARCAFSATAESGLAAERGARRRPRLLRVVLGVPFVSYGPRGVRQVPPAVPAGASARGNRRIFPTSRGCGARPPEAAPRAHPPSCAVTRRVVPPRGQVAGRRADSQTLLRGRSTSHRACANGPVRRFGGCRATIED